MPLFASSEFRGKSRRGLYGDVVEELDDSVGRILSTLAELKIDERTLVFFTSDNGPWLDHERKRRLGWAVARRQRQHLGGGMREPAIAWWPGRIPAAVRSAELASTLDLFATIHALLDIPLPSDRTLDSFDIRPVLLGTGPSPRPSFFYYRGTHLMAVRLGPWKAHFVTQPALRNGKPTEHDPPQLYNLDHDPSEANDVAKDHPEVVAEIRQLVEQHTAGVSGPLRN